MKYWGIEPVTLSWYPVNPMTIEDGCSWFDRQAFCIPGSLRLRPTPQLSHNLLFFGDSLVSSSLSLTSFASLFLYFPSGIKALWSVQFSWSHSFTVTRHSLEVWLCVKHLQVLTPSSTLLKPLCVLYWYSPYTDHPWPWLSLRKIYILFIAYILLKDLASRRTNAKKPNHDAMEPTRTACEVLCPAGPAKAPQD